MKNTTLLRALLALPIFIIVFAFSLDYTPVSINGTITNDFDKPVYNAEITLDKNGYKIFVTHTNRLGKYQFKNIKPGTYTFSVGYKNYNAYRGVLLVTEGADLEKNFVIFEEDGNISEINYPEIKVVNVGWTRN